MVGREQMISEQNSPHGTSAHRTTRGFLHAALVPLAVTGLLFVPAVAGAQVWPEDGQWRALTTGGTPIGDPQGDGSGERDIVGDAGEPAAYVHSDASFLYFRLRVDATVLSTPSDFKAFGWACEIDIDGDPEGYEFIAGVDGLISLDVVELRQNLFPLSGGNPKDIADMQLAMYPPTTHARESPAASTFGGNADVFIDWAVDKYDLTLAGVNDEETPLRIICGTSNNARSLTADLISESNATTLPDLVTDPVACGSTGCSVPCTGFGEACTVGMGDCETWGTKVCDGRGNAVCNALPGDPIESPEVTCDSHDNDCDGVVDEGCSDIDSDGDALTDEQEAMLGSDPLDADTDDDGVLDGDSFESDIESYGDIDGDGYLNIHDPDSDNDGLFDGTEMGITECTDQDTDLSAGHCRPDADPTTTTSPDYADSDNGGEPDGSEDVNKDGAVEFGEKDPNEQSDDDGDNDDISYVHDLCPYAPDPTNANRDGDEFGDACDNDIDGDGLANYADPCPFDPRLSCPNPEIDVTACASHAAGHGDARGLGALLMAALLLVVRRSKRQAG